MFPPPPPLWLNFISWPCHRRTFPNPTGRREEPPCGCPTAPAQCLLHGAGVLGAPCRLLCEVFSLPFSLDNLINYTDEVNQHQKKIWQPQHGPQRIAMKTCTSAPDWLLVRLDACVQGLLLVLLIFTELTMNYSRQKMKSHPSKGFVSEKWISSPTTNRALQHFLNTVHKTKARASIGLSTYVTISDSSSKTITFFWMGKNTVCWFIVHVLGGRWTDTLSRKGCCWVGVVCSFVGGISLIWVSCWFNFFSQLLLH